MSYLLSHMNNMIVICLILPSALLTQNEGCVKVEGVNFGKEIFKLNQIKMYFIIG